MSACVGMVGVAGGNPRCAPHPDLLKIAGAIGAVQRPSRPKSCEISSSAEVSTITKVEIAAIVGSI